MADQPKFTEDLESVFTHSKRWLTLKVNYLKLTLAEKLAVAAAALIAGVIAIVLAVIAIIFLAISIIEAFKLILIPTLAYLAAAGSMLVLAVIVFLLRNCIFGNLIARSLTKLLFTVKKRSRGAKESEPES